jgi:hypothetical protein
MLRPDLLASLCEPFTCDRKGEVPAGCENTFQLPVFCHADGRVVSLYDRTFIEAAVKRWPGVVPALTALQVEALDAADALAAELRLDMVLQRGDVQFLHNHALWHARSAFADLPGARSARHLLRLWLAAPPDEAWALPPAFAERFGTVDAHAQPPRGGIRCPGMRPNAPLTVD